MAWCDARDEPALVWDAGAGWAVAEVPDGADRPVLEQSAGIDSTLALAGAIARSLAVPAMLASADEFVRVQPDGSSAPLGHALDEWESGVTRPDDVTRSDAERVTRLAAELDVAPVLIDPDLHLTPPLARQVAWVRTPDPGLLQLVARGDLPAGFVGLRRGDLACSQRWNAPGRLAGLRSAGPPEAARVAGLRRRGAPAELLGELVDLLSLPGAETAQAVLLGRLALEDQPTATTVEPAGSLREGLWTAASAPLRAPATDLPALDLVAAVATPPVGVLWGVRVADLLNGSIDGFGIAQLVGSTLTIPWGVWSAWRVVTWFRKSRSQPAEMD